MAESSTPLLSSPSQRNGNSSNHNSAMVKWFHVFKKEIVVFSGPLAMALILNFVKIEEGPKAAHMLGALVWLALWWILEPVPLCVTALVPLVLFPALRIMDADEVAKNYANDTVTLMLGTFILALAIEKVNLHKRIALRILLFFGGEKMDPRKVLLGFCAGPAFVSMWMSNTAATIMMIPMATGVLKHFDASEENDAAALCKQCSRSFSQKHMAWNESDIVDPEEQAKKKALNSAAVKKEFSKGVILAIVYGTAVGGLSTITGCGPNLVLPGIYSGRFPKAPPVQYFQWMLFALPVALPLLLFLWLMLCYFYCPASSVDIIEASFSREYVEQEYENLGSMRFGEKFVGGSFVVLVILWCTRTLGDYPGWSDLLGGYPNEGTVAIMVAILFFLVPSGLEKGDMLMDWGTCKKLHWDVLILLGGGFALSAGMSVSGLDEWLGNYMQILHSVPYWLLIPVVSLFINIATEFASNVAMATLFLPLLAELAISIGQHPLLLMVPATFSCNYSFILPVATPPNAIAHSTGYTKPIDMVAPGFLLKVVGIFLISVLMPTLGSWVFNLNDPMTDFTRPERFLVSVFFASEKFDSDLELDAGMHKTDAHPCPPINNNIASMPTQNPWGMGGQGHGYGYGHPM